MITTATIEAKCDELRQKNSDAMKSGDHNEAVKTFAQLLILLELMEEDLKQSIL